MRTITDDVLSMLRVEHDEVMVRGCSVRAGCDVGAGGDLSILGRLSGPVVVRAGGMLDLVGPLVDAEVVIEEHGAMQLKGPADGCTFDVRGGLLINGIVDTPHPGGDVLVMPGSLINGFVLQEDGGLAPFLGAESSFVHESWDGVLRWTDDGRFVPVE